MGGVGAGGGTRRGCSGLDGKWIAVDEALAEADFPEWPGAHVFWLFLDPADDPREGGPTLGDEKATLAEFLRFQRLPPKALAPVVEAACLIEPAILARVASLM